MEASTPTAPAAEPHATSVVAFDIPSAIPAGEPFRMKVGIKCVEECPLADGTFVVHSHEGAQVAAGVLGDDRWPGTTGLHVTEVELQAPAEEGLYTWSVKVPRAGAEPPHAEADVEFGVRVVRPEYVVTVEALETASRAPLQGARVVMHPYRAVTDERGVATLKVAGGTYKLFVSQTRYVTFGLPVEVTADLTARAELVPEPESERN